MARPKTCKRCGKLRRPAKRKYRKAPGYCRCGRPTKMQPDTIQKLEDAFTNAMSDQQACAYAGVSTTALYEYQKRNPKFAERKTMLKLRPDIAAKKTVVGSLDDPQHAWKWLERRDPDFMPKSKVEHGGGVTLAALPAELGEEEREALDTLRKARRRRIEASAAGDDSPDRERHDETEPTEGPQEGGNEGKPPHEGTHGTDGAAA